MSNADATPFDRYEFKTCWCNWLPFLLQLVLGAAIGSFLFGLNLSLLNTSLEYIAWEFEWCNFKGGKDGITSCRAYTIYSSFISSAVFMGAAIGSMISGYFMSMGRRAMILVSMVVFIAGSVSSLCSNSFVELMLARMVTGCGVGLVSVCCPAYMSEMTPSAVRGKYGVLHQLFVTIGILCGTLLGLPTAFKLPIPSRSVVEDIPKIDTFGKIWWRVMFGVGLLPVILVCYLLGIIFHFETPYYYLERDQETKAKELLKIITNKDDVTEELLEIRTNVQESQKSNMTLAQGWSYRSDYRCVIILSCVFSAFQQLGGINVFIASSNKLFGDAGLDGVWPTVLSNLMFVANCLVTFLPIGLIERMGRRQLVLFGTIGMTIAVAPAAIMYLIDANSEITRWLAIVGSICYVMMSGATYGPVLWVYLAEIFPIEIKGAAAGLATAVNWSASIIMVFVSSYLENKQSFMLLFVLNAISVFIVFQYMLETKGRALGDSPYVTNN